MKRGILSSICILTVLFSLQAQIYNPVNWKFSSKQLSDEIYELRFIASIDKGWHMYGLEIPDGGPIATSFNFNENPDVEFINKTLPSRKAEVKFDPTFEMDLELFDNHIEFTQEVRILSGKSVTVDGYLEFMACDDSKCLPPKEVDFSLQLETKTTSSQALKEKVQETEVTEVEESSQEPPKIETDPVELSEVQDSEESVIS